MSRKEFLIWGVVIILICVASVPIMQYLGLSKIIDLKKLSAPFGLAQLTLPIIGFGTILFLRFKQIGRRKRVLALCLLFYISALPVAALLILPYFENIVDNSGAQERFFKAIGEWASLEAPKSDTPWSVKHKIDYILVMLPLQIIANWGLFALLWFGSLDPRTPSKNGFIRFMKHGFQRKVQPSICPTNKHSHGVTA